MEFKKYSSIENDYNSKFIQKFLDDDIWDKPVVLLEKIDGCNFQIKMQPDSPMKFGRRSAFLKDDENFYDFKSAVKKIEPQLLDAQRDIDKYGDVVVTFYFELCGPGIQNRCNYGDDKQLLCFDVHEEYPDESRFMDFTLLLKVLNKYNLPMVPILKTDLTLKEALEFEVNGMNSQVLGIENNEAEGVVIRLMEEEIFNYHNQRFILKRKADNFKEKNKEKIPKVVDDLVLQWQAVVRSYVNENRILSVFSKEGEIEDQKEIGKYIKLVMEDVKEDMLKDYLEFKDLELTKTQRKNIHNVIGKLTVDILRKYL